MKKINFLALVSFLIISSEFSSAQAAYRAFAVNEDPRAAISTTNTSKFIRTANDLNGTRTYEFSGNPFPYIKLTQDITSGRNAEARMEYDFEVTGAANSLMPLNMTSYSSGEFRELIVNYGNNSAMGRFMLYGSSIADIENSYPNFDLQSERIFLNGQQIFSQTAGTRSFNFRGDAGSDGLYLETLLNVRLDENGYGKVNVNMWAIGNTYIDPYFYIADEYLALNPTSTIILNSGVGNANPLVSSVPEPEAYAMLLAGFGLIGFATRRKSNTQYS